MRKYIFRIILLIVAVTGSVLMLGSWKSAAKQEPCEETMDQSSCQEHKKTNHTMLESLSGQFFSSF